MTPQELKNSILQLAIQGKLVEQRPEEGTAEELFARIQEEKRRLIKEGKIKREKPLPEITEDEKPFEIPESWMWVRLGEIFQHNTGKALNSTNRSGVSLKYITTSNLYWNRFELSNLKEMFFTDTELEKCTVQKGDLLVCEGGDIGRAAIWQSDNNIRIQNHIHRLRSYITVCTEFFYYLFYLYKHAGWIGGKGIGIQGLSSKSIHILVFPLPPLAEQKRIVAKIEELLPYIDRYEQAWSKLEQFNGRFPEDMKKSLLQYAIQGKLVEQRSEEGTGEELFAQIQAEKQRLIKAGKIKKEKPLPEITDDEKPFEIPESWMWVRLGVVSTIQSSKRVFEKDYTSEGIPFFRSKEIGDLYRGEEIKTQLFISREHYEQLKKDYGVPQAGDILITSVGTIGNTWICDGREFYYKDGNITQICSNRFLYPRFLQFYIESPLFLEQANTTVSGTAYNALTIIKLKQMMLPLPPLAEQKRIVEKLEQLLPLCERLKQDSL